MGELLFTSISVYLQFVFLHFCNFFFFISLICLSVFCIYVFLELVFLYICNLYFCIPVICISVFLKIMVQTWYRHGIMVETWIHVIETDSCYRHRVMVQTWTHGIYNSHGTQTHGIVQVLLSHTSTGGLSVTHVRNFSILRETYQTFI